MGVKIENAFEMVTNKRGWLLRLQRRDIVLSFPPYRGCFQVFCLLGPPPEEPIRGTLHLHIRYDKDDKLHVVVGRSVGRGRPRPRTIKEEAVGHSPNEWV